MTNARWIEGYEAAHMRCADWLASVALTTSRKLHGPVLNGLGVHLLPVLNFDAS